MAQILDLGKIRFNWAGTYSSGTSYSYNDLVKYGPNLYAYVATAASAGTVPTDTSKWVSVTQGVQYRGVYTNSTKYYVNDIVFDGTSTWIVVTEHTSVSSGATTSSNAYVQMIALGQPGLPTQTNNVNKVLTTDGNNPSWTGSIKMNKSYFGVTQGTGAYTFESSAALTDSVSVFTASSSNFVQLPVANVSNGANASTDFIAYTADGTNDSGWVDMGITSNNFSAATFGITGPHDGYIFMSAPRIAPKNVTAAKVIGSVATLTTDTTHGYTVGNVVKIEGVADGGGTGLTNGLVTVTAVTSTTFSYATTVTPFAQVNLSPFGTTYKPKGNGNLVFATDRTGLSNSIVFAAGGYDSGTTQMSITPNQTVNVAITTASTSATTGALTVSGGAGITGDLWTNGTTHIGGVFYAGNNTAGAWAASNLLTGIAGVVEVTSSSNSYGQIAFHNRDASSSVDFIAYPDNGNDSHGWIDMGMTGSTFNQSTYGITGPNDGYLFVDAPVGSTGYGNLVLATGSQGTRNRIVFAAGGFASGHTQMEIVPDTAVKINIATASTSATTGALVVTGGVGITGDVNIAGNITFGGTGTNVSTANLAVNAPLVFTGSGSIVSTNDLGIVTEGKYSVTNIPVQTVINKAITNNVATLTTLLPHAFVTGDSVVVANIDATFNGTYTVASTPSTTTFTYAKTNANVASTAIGPVAYTVTVKALSSNVATLTTSVAHALTVGTQVFVAGVDSTFNGQWAVTAITSNTFSYAVTASNVSSTSATGTATYYTSVSTASVGAATRTRWSAWTKKAADGIWNLVTNISTLPTTSINYNQNTYLTSNPNATPDIAYDQVKLGGITIQGSGASYGAPYGSLVFTGNITSPAWTTTGLRHIGSSASTLTDTSSSGTVAAAYTNTFGSNVTVAASSATTYTDYANAYFGGTTAGTNVTITNNWSILTAGAVKVGGALSVVGNTTLTGTLQANSNVAVGSNVFTVASATGNTAISGTLTATGLATLNGGIAGGSSANITINTNKFTVDATTGNTAVAGTFGASGNTTVGGTLSVTGLASFPGGISVTGTERFTGRFDVQEMREDISNVTLSSGTLTVDYSVANVYYSATAPSAAFTINLTNVPTDNDKAISISVIQVQGATGYIPSTFQIDGASQTIKWAGGSAPSPTSTSGKLDIFNFSLLRTGSAWIVLGSANLNY
jgi:hypothetical protein